MFRVIINLRDILNIYLLKNVISLFIVIILFCQTKIQAQCNLTETITICDMTVVDIDSNGTPDGIINLYDEYNTISGGSISLTTGVWFDPNFNFALDESTGNLHLWDLDNASTTVTDYQFQLIDTNSSCTDGIRVTLNLVLGPFSGYARPVFGLQDVNLEVCDIGSTPDNICIPLPDVDLFESLESLPSPHLNGQWVYNGSSPNFVSLSGSELNVSIPYTPGPPLVDQETFELTYIVNGISPCNLSMETTVNISVTRQVFSGYSQNKRVCELDIINGNYNSDINLNDDEFLLLEDVEGVWAADSYGQITSPIDPLVNLSDVYQQIITNNGLRFGCAEVDFTYSVDQRSGVCENKSSVVSFKIYEYLRPFSQNAPLEYCEDSATIPASVNLYNQLEFTTEGGILFDYFDNNYTNWAFVSGPSDLGLISNDSSGYSSLGTVNLSNASPGTYTFEYTVLAGINCPTDSFESLNYNPDICSPTPDITGFCQSEIALVTLIIHPKLYAGEDTIGLEFCENDPLIANPIDLFTLLGTNGVDDPVYQGPLGTWTDLDTGTIFTNPITLAEVNNQQTFNFIYSTLSSNNCEDNANLSFTIYEEYQSGTGGTMDVCNTSTSFDLFDSLTGDPNIVGTWSGPNGFATTDHHAVFNPATSDAGTYVYTVPDNVNSDGTILCNGSSTSIVVTSYQSPNAGADMLGNACQSNVQIDLTNFLDAVADSGGIFNDLDQTNELSGNILNVSQLSGTYNFQYEIQGHTSCSLSTSLISITVNEVSVPTSVNQTFCASEGATIAYLKANNGVTYNWYDTIDSDVPLSFNTPLVNNEDYFVSALDNQNCESARVGVSVIILPIDHVDCDTCIKDGVSANGDGINDEFDLCNLPVTFPNFEINIYNRHGALVYKGNQNTPLFKGESNVSLTMGNALPSGIYFYVFDPKDSSAEVFQGNFYLSR